MSKGIPDEFDITLRGEGTHDIDLSLDLLGLDNINTAVTLQGGDAPVATDSTATLHVPEPIRTEAKLEGGEPIRTDVSLAVQPLEATLDVKPLTADVCLNLGLNRLPPTQVSSPFTAHFGITLLGVELVGFNLRGDRELRIEPIEPARHVAWGGTEARGGGDRPRPGHAQPRGAGLRIRLEE